MTAKSHRPFGAHPGDAPKLRNLGALSHNIH
jgi:hypothetical protein